MGNHEDHSQVDADQPKKDIPKKEKTPWEKLAIGLRSVRLLKDPVRLRELRGDANMMKVEFQKEVNSLETKLTHEADPLEKLADTKEIEKVNKYISTIDKGLVSIQSRATALTEENDGKSNS